jgi:hypothetical protein
LGNTFDAPNQSDLAVGDFCGDGITTFVGTGAGW